AIDIRLADVPLPKLREAALAAGRGGVGYYPASNFVHVDTGRVRQW
ncbi:MAG: YcbK family protein, partial [Vicinamibacterales bacterium]